MKLILVSILLINISLSFLEKMLLFIHLSTKLMNWRELNLNMAQLFADIFIAIQIFSSLLVNLFATNKITRKYSPPMLLEYLWCICKLESSFFYEKVIQSDET